MKTKFLYLFMEPEKKRFIRISLIFGLLLLIPVVKAQLSFTDSGQNLGTGNSSSVALGDIDNDGDLDAVVSNGTYGLVQDVEIWFNDSTGNFTKADQTLNHGLNQGVSLADLNGDGNLDIFLCVGWGGPNKVYFNDGHGHFTDSGQNLGSGTNSGLVRLADLDGDGDIDAFVCIHPIWQNNNWSNFGNEVWLNDGQGYFTNAGSQKLGNGYYNGLSIGDINGDGNIDAATTSNNLNLGNKIWVNNGNAYYNESSSILSNDNAVDITFGDLDGDSDLDAFLIYYNYSNSAYYYGAWINDGNGNFIKSDQNFGHLKSNRTCLGDIDNDGDMDAFISGANTSSLWENSGNGIFTDSIEIGNDESNDVKLGDLDGDGDIDAFVANNGPNKVYINDNKIYNNAPSTPSGLATAYILSLTDVILSWNHATDDHTPIKGLNYNLFVIRDGDTVSTRPPMADTTTGLRMIPDKGMSQDTFCMLKNLNGGNYRWGVQAIDGAFKGGLFATGTFTIEGTGIKNYNQSEIKVYPNPTSGLVNIYFKPTTVQKATIEMYNLQGKLIFTEAFPNTTTATISLNGYPSGMYIIKLTLDEEIIYEKILKQ